MSRMLWNFPKALKLSGVQLSRNPLEWIPFFLVGLPICLIFSLILILFYPLAMGLMILKSLFDPPPLFADLFSDGIRLTQERRPDRFLHRSEIESWSIEPPISPYWYHQISLKSGEEVRVYLVNTSITEIEALTILKENGVQVVDHRILE